MMLKKTPFVSTIIAFLFSGTIAGAQQIVCVSERCDSNNLDELYLEVRPDSSSIFPPFTINYDNIPTVNGCPDLSQAGVSLIKKWSLRPKKDDNPLNGVTTYDLLLIGYHVRGIRPFTEPWQWIAADANRDNQITLQDSVELSKLILGEYLELPNNTSWRFVRADYQFPSPNPLSQPIPDSIAVPDLIDSMYVKFWGVKIGNVSCLTLTGQNSVEAPAPWSEIKVCPNPTFSRATIHFHLMEAGKVQVKVRDLSGRLLYSLETDLPAGPQLLDIPATAFNGPGTYLIQLQNGQSSSFSRLLRL